jgi:predicted RND superfamily exporter protein
MENLVTYRFHLLGSVLVLTTAVCIVGGAPRVNNSLDVWFLEDDPTRIAYEDFQQSFGNDEILVAAIGRGGVSMGDHAQTLQDLCQRAQRIEGLAGCVAPTGNSNTRGSRRLWSQNQQSAMVVFRMGAHEHIDQERPRIHDEIRALIAGAHLSSPIQWAGMGLVYDELNRESLAQTPKFLGLTFVLIALALFAMFGRVGPVAIALGVVGITIAMVFGIFALAGEQLNMVSAILPTLLLVTGTTNVIHIMNHRVQHPSLDSAGVMLGVLKPCLFTSLTTAAGFLALTTAKMGVIRQLGVYAALGVVVSLVVSYVAAAIALNVRPLGPKVGGTGLLLRIAQGPLHGATSRPKTVVGLACVTMVLACVAGAGIEVNTYPLGFFGEKHPVRTDSEHIEATFGSYLPLEFAVVAPQGSDIMNPAFLGKIWAWEDAVQRELGLPIRRSARTLPAPGKKYAGTSFPLSSERKIRTTFAVPMTGSDHWKKWIVGAQQLADGHLPKGATLERGGYLPLYVSMMEHIVGGQIHSFVAALVLVFSLMGLLFRQWRYVAIATLPNLLPIGCMLGLMAGLDIRLDVATVTIAAIVLGIVVDDTVHVLHAYKKSLLTGASRARAARESVSAVAPALLGTTLVLGLGFSVLALASLKSISLFGVLVVWALLLALVADLLLLPALLVLFGPRAPSHG